MIYLVTNNNNNNNNNKNLIMKKALLKKIVETHFSVLNLNNKILSKLMQPHATIVIIIRTFQRR